MKIRALHTINFGKEKITAGGILEVDEELGRQLIATKAGVDHDQVIEVSTEDENEVTGEGEADAVELDEDAINAMDYPTLKETVAKLELQTLDQKAETLKDALLAWLDEDEA